MMILIKEGKSQNFYLLNPERKFEYKGICIYFRKNAYYVLLEDNIFFTDGSKIKRLCLQEYVIKSDQLFYDIRLFVYKNNKGLDRYNLYSYSDFIIADNACANIICKDKYLHKYYLSLIKGKIKSNYDFTVNNQTYDNDYLNIGDVIAYQGIKIIYFKDFLYINNFECDIKLEEYQFNQQKIKYLPEKYQINYNCQLLDFKLELEEIKPFNIKKQNKDNDFWKMIIPNIFMCLSCMIMASINYYSSFLANQLSLNSISYLIMPITMFISSILVPFIFSLKERKRNDKSYQKEKDKYLKYLDEYEKSSQTKIKEYVKNCNVYYFSLTDIKEKIFSVSKKSKYYLHISLGTYNVPYDLKYSSSSDEDIDKRLKQINHNINSIDSYPLFLDLSDNRIITIISSEKQKEYFFLRFLLELTYKHYFDDIKVGVYAKDYQIIDKIYNLPHLFVGKQRLSFTDCKQLRQLDQMRLSKPLFLFLYDKSSIVFSNKNIHILYFSNDINDTYKDSDALIDYHNGISYLIKNQKIAFKHIEEKIDFDKYFHYLGKLSNYNSKSNFYNFQKVFSGKDIKENYQKHDRFLKAFFSYKDNELLCLDLHEDAQGPHGLIGGTTGSGKSELIISMLLSLVIKYPPDYLNIILIDYKGGGIKESLSANGEPIPHIIAAISNLDNGIFERMMAYLLLECKRRQEAFRKMSRSLNKSIMNLDDYLNDIDKDDKAVKFAHLLIVIDEFAELKKENPELIKELISISRIGRSLGIHLILATQRPAGVIDDEIWSNSHFKIALKVFEEKDSFDLIKCKDAAYLNKPGCFLLQVDESLIKAQSIYARNDIQDNDPYKVSLLDDNLQVIKNKKLEIKQTVSEISYYCKQIIDVCKKQGIKTTFADFYPSMPIDRKKYNINNELLLGRKDDYLNDNKDLLSYKITDDILIYSSRKNEINAILNALCEAERPTVVIGSCYYQNSYICDSLSYNQDTDIQFLFDVLLNNINQDLTLVIEDISALLAYEERYLDILYKLLRRGKNNRISFIFITTMSNISYKLLNYFNQRIMINITDNNQLIDYYSSRSNYKGNSYYYDKQPISFVPIKVESLINDIPKIPEIIKHIPEIIYPQIDNNGCLIGYDIKTREKIYINDQLLITSYDDNILDYYRKAYGDIFIVSKYQHSLVNENHNNILWLSSGFFFQRLLSYPLKQDLSVNEGLLLYKGKKCLIRSINYA